MAGTTRPPLIRAVYRAMFCWSAVAIGSQLLGTSLAYSFAGATLTALLCLILIGGKP